MKTWSIRINGILPKQLSEKKNILSYNNNINGENKDNELNLKVLKTE